MSASPAGALPPRRTGRSSERRPPLVIVAGPTATGKTDLAIEIALAIRAPGRPADIISADSRQIYRGMDVGTAKPTMAERRGVPHHGLDLVEPDQAFSVADFVEHATGVLAALADTEGVAILAGGTGFWIAAVAGGLPVEQLPWDPDVRAVLEADLARDGLPSLVTRLRGLAPARAGRTDLHNPRRVVRALEIATLAGDAPLPTPAGYPGPILRIAVDVARPRAASGVDRAARRDAARWRHPPGGGGAPRALRPGPARLLRASATARPGTSWTVAWTGPATLPSTFAATSPSLAASGRGSAGSGLTSRSTRRGGRRGARSTRRSPSRAATRRLVA